MLVRVAVVLNPVFVFVFSLTQNVVITENGESTILAGISAFCMGETAILGGGILEWLIWLANPIALLSIILFLSKADASGQTAYEEQFPLKKSVFKSGMLSLLAAGIGWSFIFWDEILASESGATFKIISLELGYWIWVASLSILALSINCYYYLYSKNPELVRT